MRRSVDARTGLDRIVAALAGGAGRAGRAGAGAGGGGEADAPEAGSSDAGATGARRVVLLDGRSGSGKSTLATMAVERAPDTTLVRLDDVYPGWDGLRAASDQLVAGILAPCSRGRAGGFHRWDWAAGTPGPWETVDPAGPLLIEGVGALPAAARPWAVLTVWVELDDAARRERALARDGETYAPHWNRWAAQEEEYLAREHPAVSADLVIDGRSILG